MIEEDCEVYRSILIHTQKKTPLSEMPAMPKNIALAELLHYMGWSYDDYMRTPRELILAIKIKMQVEYEQQNTKNN